MGILRISQKVKKYLKSGSKNTNEILNMVNNSFRHGTNYQQLGKVLSGDRDIVKIGHVKCVGAMGSYPIFVWALKEVGD